MIKRTLVAGLALCALLALMAGSFAQTVTGPWVTFILGSPSGAPTGADILPCIENGDINNTHQCTLEQLLSQLSAAQISASGGLLKSNNLADVADTSIAASNIGALQRSNNLSDVSNTVTALGNLGGLAKAANLSDLSSTLTAISNLGALARANDLSDLSSTSTASANLGVTATGRAATGQIPGTSTNDSASAGDVGEYVSAQVLDSAAIGLSTGVPQDITHITLSAGDWTVWGSLGIVPAGSTTLSTQTGWINTVSATQPQAPNSGALVISNQSLAEGAEEAWPLGAMRLSLSTTTTIYLSMTSYFSGSTNAGFGFLGARRTR
jgi:hypothetical protein